MCDGNNGTITTKTISTGEDPYYEAMSGKIAVEPFPSTGVEKQVSSGFAAVKQKVALTPLRVIFGTKDILAGNTVYVRGDLCVNAEYKKVYEIEGQQFILLPISEVLIMKGSYLWQYSMPAHGVSWANYPIGAR